MNKNKHPERKVYVAYEMGSIGGKAFVSEARAKEYCTNLACWYEEISLDEVLTTSKLDDSRCLTPEEHHKMMQEKKSGYYFGDIE